MLYISVKEAIQKALEIAQVGNAYIPFDTLCALIDQEYRILQEQLIRNGKSGILKLAELDQQSYNDIYHCYEYLLPSNVSKITSMFQKGQFDNTPIIENEEISTYTYKQNDNLVLTKNLGPIYIEYSPILRTPTFNKTKTKIDYLYENGKDTYTIDNGILFLNNEQTFQNNLNEVVLQIWGVKDYVIVRTNQRICDTYGITLVNQVCTDIRIDPQTLDVLYLTNNTWYPYYAFKWNDRWIKMIDDSIYITDNYDSITGDIILEGDCEHFYPDSNGWLVVRTPSDNQVYHTFIPRDYSVPWDLYNRYKYINTINTDEITGNGIIANGYNYGWCPDTKFDFYHTVYYDVIVYRLSLSILSYLGLPISGQAALLDKAEKLAFKINETSNSPIRIKNNRRRPSWGI